ncbi:MAG: glycoside hydrolase family 15 protein [DPANN group archaeon]|nr:glycoside hydrolase family 15 protein [DPANN group archaeon]
MTRHIVLGNQSFLVNIDRWLQVRDIYFPHVGQYNHLIGHAHRIGVLEHNELSWLDGQEWERNLCYENETLVTDNKAVNKDRQLSIRLKENVYCEDNIFFRKMTVRNDADRKRKLRICFHQDFHLYGDGIGDTALYHMEKQAVIHYKRSAYFLIGLADSKGRPVLDGFDIGEHVTPGWHTPDNPVAQGEVDSLLCIDLELGPKKETTFTYYLLAGTCFDEVYALQDRFLREGVDAHLRHAEQCQRGWLGAVQPDLKKVDKRLQELYKRSLLIIKTQIDKGGAITAANDTDNLQYNKDTYSYLWPRDGALVSIALIRAGYPEYAKRFFLFCRDVLEKGGYLMHKYNPDKTLGSSWHPWVLHGEHSLPIQEDETALVLRALDIYHRYTKDDAFIREHYDDLIRPMGDFLTRYRHPNGLPKESYDLWEERRAIFTFTTSAVLSGLVAASRFAHLLSDKKFCQSCDTGFDLIKKAMVKYLWNDKDGYFRRGVSIEGKKVVFDNAMDASVYGLYAFDVFPADDPKIVSTMERMKEWLWVKTSVGGFARYYNDHYHRVSNDLKNIPGNPWFITTLWYAKWLIRVSRTKEDLKEAKKLIDWAADHSLSTGVMPEQLDPHSGEPLSVSPLTWSHAEFVDTINDYIEKREEIG